MNRLSLNGFILKIIAIVTMTLDHIAMVFIDYLSIDAYSALKIIGRISFPLFAFLIVEGIIHTKNKQKYLTRLGLSAILISLAIFLLYTWGETHFVGGNIFVTLFMGASIIWCLMLKKYQKLWAIPLFGVCYLLQLPFIPYYLLISYDLFGILLILAFYGAILLTDVLIVEIAKKYEVDSLSFKQSPYYQKLRNLLSSSVLLILVLIYYFIYKTFSQLDDRLNISIQAYCILAGAFLLFYDGTRGYNKKWFQNSCYFYYPLHLIIIYGIFILFY